MAPFIWGERVSHNLTQAACHDKMALPCYSCRHNMKMESVEQRRLQHLRSRQPALLHEHLTLTMNSKKRSSMSSMAAEPARLRAVRALELTDAHACRACSAARSCDRAADGPSLSFLAS